MHALKKYAPFLVVFILTVSSFSGICQTINTSSFSPENDSLRGKLLYFTECHEVRSNLPEYLELISKLTSNFSSTDTLNIFLEAPFTMTHFINEYLKGKNRFLTDSILKNDPRKIEFYFSLRKLKKNIRFVGADFEYDQGNPGGRFESFKLYFDELKDILNESKLDLSVIKSFIYGIKVQGLEEADFYTFKKYVQKLSINQSDLVLKAKLKEANFVLAALQKFEKTDVRDKAYYSRVIELNNSIISVQRNYNIILFGSIHGNPYNEKSLYVKLNSSEDSPFKNNVAIFANIYIDCLSYGSYNERSIVLENAGLYYGSKEDKILMDLITKEYMVKNENTFVVYRNSIKSNMKDIDKVLYWGVHYKVK